MLTSALATSLLNFTYETSGDMTAAEATGFIAFMTAYMGFISLFRWRYTDGPI